jgi:hypothetical protein
LARIAALSAIASPNEICLLHNTKSAMTAREQADFANKQPVTVDQSNAANARTIYDSAFNAIKMNMTSVKAVIISADPWFLATRQDLVNAGNASTFHVCYPLKEYKTETNPKPKHSRIHAPKERLDGAYKLLGSRAKDYINDNSKMTFDDAQLDVPDPLP